MTAEPHSEHQPAGGRTAAQNRALWRRVGELERLYGAGNGELRMRAVVREVTGSDCTRRLTAAQAARVLERLAHEVRAAEKARRSPEPAEPPTGAQQEAIEAYRVLMGLSSMGLQKLCRRVNGDLRPWPQSRAESIKLFEALKSMFSRKVRREEGFARGLEIRLQVLAEGDVTEWERRFLADIRSRLTMGLAPTPGAVVKLVEIERTRKTIAPAPADSPP